MSEQDFDRILNDAVSETMSQLGETVRQTIAYYLEKNFGVKAEEIPRKTGEFGNALGAMLGPGANKLELTILSKLSTRIDVKVTVLTGGQEVHFAESVSRAAELYRSHSAPATSG